MPTDEKNSHRIQIRRNLNNDQQVGVKLRPKSGHLIYDFGQ